MSRNPFIGALAILLVSIVASAVFFIAPQRTFAQSAAINCLFGGGAAGAGGGAAGAAAVSVPTLDALNLAANSISAGATTGSCLDTTILKPLARMLARIVLQQITASTINWITGKNGNGQPSFVTNLSVHLQSVGDAAAFPFINQVATAFNSPFGSAISFALRTNYSQQTSVAGFFAAHQSTLPGSLQSQQAFLAGNWSQGGIASWFALTTRTENNPYTLYQAAQSQLGSNVSQAQTNRRQDLVQSGGFLSWCGGDTTSASACVATSNGSCPQGCIADDNAATGCSLSGVSPQAPCTNPDGTPAKASTPGSIIHDYTSKAVVSAGIDQLVSAQDLDQALGAIALALVSQVLGGSGLLGASAPSSSRPAFTTQLQNYAASNAAAAASATALAQSTLARLGAYTNAWTTISTAANTASTSAASLANFCTAAADTAATAMLNAGNETGIVTTPSPATLSSVHTIFIDASRAQAVAAQTAITTEIAPVLLQAQTQSAPSFVSATQALALKVESEALAVTSVTAATTGVAGALTADTQALAAAPPSAIDVANVQENARASGGGRASPVGSLTVSGGSLVDRMNLISTNAATLKTTVCNPNSSLYVSDVFSAG